MPIVRQVLVEPSCPQFDIITSRKQVNLFLAGQGSGKSHVAGIVAALCIQAAPNVHGFIGANTYLQLSDSTLFRIRKVWKEFFDWTEWSKENPNGCYVIDIQPPVHFNTDDHEYDTYHGKICFQWGTVVYKGSLDNYKAHEGKEFAWAILDETKDTKEQAVKEVITGRLREHGMYVNSAGELVDRERIEKDRASEIMDKYEPFTPLYIFTSPAKVQWINQWFNLDDHSKEITELIYSDTTYFIKDIENKRVVISSTFHNLKNLPSNYISNQKSNLHSALQDMLIYGNPFTSTGGEFYKCFIRTKHVIDVRKIPGFNNNGRAYNPLLPLHLSFDFNLNPYMTCTIWQNVIREETIDEKQVTKKYVYQIDEVCLANPKNTSQDVCKEVIRRYQGHDAGMFIYGDPQGRIEDTKTERGHNDYTVIVKALHQFNPRLRISNLYPPVVARGNWINTIFELGYEGMEIYIHQGCVKSIDDYVYLKESSDGKLKEKVKNPDTGVTYEKFGHTSDSGDYYLCLAFATEFNKYKAGGTTPTKPSSGKAPQSRNTY